MISELAKNWWVVALRGVLAIVFGLMAFFWPGLTISVLVLFFGAYILIDGIFTIFTALRTREEHTRWWALLFEGLASIIAGGVIWGWTGLSVIVLMYFIAAWSLITGMLEIIAAIRLRQQIEGEWRLALSGVLSIVFAILVAIWPLAGAVAVAWLIGFYAILFGIALLALAFRLRGHNERVASAAPA